MKILKNVIQKNDFIFHHFFETNLFYELNSEELDRF